MFQQSKRDLHEWNRAADTYSQPVGGPDDRICRQLKPVLWEALGEVKGLAVLDSGYGHGWLSGDLSAAGAYVTGIDGSTTLLDRAKRAYPGIFYSTT